MELLNGLYKLDNDGLNITVKRNTSNVDKYGNIVYQNLGHFTKMANALKFLHEYHVKTKLNGLNDIERIIDVLSQSSAEVLKAIENIKDSDLDIIYMKK
jgi:hypothetical protein